MKKKLIALTVLSIIGSVGFIMWVAAAATVTDRYVYIDGNYSKAWADLWYGIFGCLVFWGCFIAQFVIGIVVLSTKTKHGDISGVTTAAGIIGILGGIIFVGSIVSGIAAAKANNNISPISLSVAPLGTASPAANDELAQMRKELEELKKANVEKEKSVESAQVAITKPAVKKTLPTKKQAVKKQAIKK